ncbi:MAG: M23 family metallopeptidase [Bacteroidales bacterium]|nr:M23 family metallopeptidase [Bacteroidales bacterium]
MPRNNKQKNSSLKSRLRVSIINDDSHKELFYFKTNKLSLLIILSVILFIIIGSTYFVIAHTGIRQTIPGYPSLETKKVAIENRMKIDSLEKQIQLWSFQMANIQRVVTGREPLKVDSITVKKNKSNADVESEYKDIYAKNDSLLRNEIQKQEKFNLSYSKTSIEQIEGLHFFTPVKGIISEGYNKALNHPFVDIAAATNTIVYSILDGTVISATWNDDTGYTIQIQHDNDIISIYKHNEQLLKSTGDKVKAGTPISLVGNTGKLSTGAHLHFELWHKGEAIDPTLYIKF